MHVKTLRDHARCASRDLSPHPHCHMATDFLYLLKIAFGLFYSKTNHEFGITLGVGIVLSAVCWFGCSHYSRLWNTRYRVTLTHHSLCAATGVLTLFFAISWRALEHTQEVSEKAVSEWVWTINQDREWSDAISTEVWRNVRALGIEDFDRPEYAQMKSTPVTHDASRLKAASTISQGCVRHFKDRHPFLSAILKARSEVPMEVLQIDIKSWFGANKGVYGIDQGIKLVSTQLKQELGSSLDRIVPTYRISAVFIFLFLQAVPFGLVGFAAYRDLKITT